MKKIFVYAVSALCLMACSEDLTDYYARLQKMESEEKAKEEEIAKRQQTIADLEAQLAEQQRWNAEQERRNAEEAAEQAAQEAAQAAQGAANDAQAQQNADQAQQNADQAQQNAELSQQNAGLGVQNGAQSALNDSLQRLVDAQGQRNGELAGNYGNMEQQNNDQQARNNQIRLMWEQLQARLQELERQINTPTENPRLLSIEFLSAENPKLKERVKGVIVGDSVIECWLPMSDIILDKKLIPRFSFDGTLVTIDGYEAQSGKTAIDFARPRTLVVATLNKRKYYTMFVHSYTGLPLLYISTDGSRAVTSKDTYISGAAQLIEDVRTRGAGETSDIFRISIKGRGNSSWLWEKKPYRIKCDEKQVLLDEHKDRSWVLVPNLADKTMIRNSFSMYLGKISNLEWTPSGHFVELFFNGRYDGTYWLCEKIKVANHRVAVGDDGFLLELDRWADKDDAAVCFTTPYTKGSLDDEVDIEIKEPEGVTKYDANYNYIVNYFTQAENALFGSNFRDPVNGWQKYLDMDSFVDWYLIHEISKNGDCMFNFSTYMNLKRGGKLKMGPIWDFDAAYANESEMSEAGRAFRETDGWLRDWSKWYTRLWQDPAFVAKVKERYNYFYAHKKDMLNYINADAAYLKYSVETNDERWGIFYERITQKNWNVWGSYQNEVQSLKTWLNERMDWIKSQLDRM